jgi:hypothetical protein
VIPSTYKLFIVPVPEIFLPLVKFSALNFSIIPSENIRPALGPPTSFNLIFIVNGY